MLACLTLAAASVTFALPSQAVDLDRLIAAIEQRENGRWTAPGGRACWTRATWRQFTRLPYALASDPASSRTMQRRVFQAYRTRFEAADVQPTPWRLAMAWRYGFDGALRARRRPNDYGSLTENLYSAGP